MKKFLSTREFKIKAKVLDFSSTQYMTDLEKKKIYVSFVKFLNNHFRWSCFNREMYQYFTNHCGFIAHYNIHGFYGEYFETAASFHFNVNKYETPMHECMGNVNRKSTLSYGELFFSIFNEIQDGKGIGEFTDQILEFRYNHKDYSDLNRAMRNALTEYICCWTDLEFESKVTNNVASVIKEVPMADKQPLKTGQSTIFDFFDLGGVA